MIPFHIYLQFQTLNMKFKCYDCNSLLGPVITYPHMNNTNIHICLSCFSRIYEKFIPVIDTESDLNKNIKNLKKALLLKVNLKFNKNYIKY